MKNGTVAPAAASGGVAASLVVILVWVLSLVHVAVPPDVAAAFGAVIGVTVHFVAVKLGVKDDGTPVDTAAKGPQV